MSSNSSAHNGGASLSRVSILASCVAVMTIGGAGGLYWFWQQRYNAAVPYHIKRLSSKKHKSGKKRWAGEAGLVVGGGTTTTTCTVGPSSEATGVRHHTSSTGSSRLTGALQGSSEATPGYLSHSGSPTGHTPATANHHDPNAPAAAAAAAASSQQRQQPPLSPQAWKLPMDGSPSSHLLFLSLHSSDALNATWTTTTTTTTTAEATATGETGSTPAGGSSSLMRLREAYWEVRAEWIWDYAGDAVDPLMEAAARAHRHYLKHRGKTTTTTNASSSSPVRSRHPSLTDEAAPGLEVVPSSPQNPGGASSSWLSQLEAVITATSKRHTRDIVSSLLPHIRNGSLLTVGELAYVLCASETIANYYYEFEPAPRPKPTKNNHNNNKKGGNKGHHSSVGNSTQPLQQDQNRCRTSNEDHDVNDEDEDEDEDEEYTSPYVGRAQSLLLSSSLRHYIQESFLRTLPPMAPFPMERAKRPLAPWQQLPPSSRQVKSCGDGSPPSSSSATLGSGEDAAGSAAAAAAGENAEEVNWWRKATEESIAAAASADHGASSAIHSAQGLSSHNSTTTVMGASQTGEGPGASAPHGSPPTKGASVPAAPVPPSEREGASGPESTWEQHRAYHLFQQLMVLQRGLLRVRQEASVHFDPKDREHMNLLEQLWIAGMRAVKDAQHGGGMASSFTTTLRPNGDEDDPTRPPQHHRADLVEGESSMGLNGNEEQKEAAEAFQRISPHWMALGFQSSDPVTDLRGAGVLGLKLLVHFAQTFPVQFGQMVRRNMSYLTTGSSAAAAAGGAPSSPLEASYYLLAVSSLHLTALLLSAVQPAGTSAFVAAGSASTATTDDREKDAGEGAPTATAATTSGMTFFTNPLEPVWHLRHFAILYDRLWFAALNRINRDMVQDYQQISGGGAAGGTGTANTTTTSSSAGGGGATDVQALHRLLTQEQNGKGVWSYASVSSGNGNVGGADTNGSGSSEKNHKKDLSQVVYAPRLGAGWWSVALPHPSRQQLPEEKGLERFQALQEAAVDGFYVLHHQLLLHFHSCWQRDRPPMVHFNDFVEHTVLPSFFFLPQ